MSPTHPASQPPRFLPLFSVIALALAVRLFLIVRSGVMIDGDEALVGLQALHILRNGERPVFFYGQAYMGSLEAYLAAAVFAVVGGPSALALRAVPLSFALAHVATTYHLASRLWNRSVAILAAVLAACPPLYVCVWTVKARGGFVETLVFGSLAFLLASRLCHAARSTPSPRGVGGWFALGVLAGVGFWVNGMIAYYLVALAPALVWAAWRAPSWALPGVVAAACGGLIGSSLLLLYNLRHGFATFSFLFGGGAHHLGTTLAQAPRVLRYFFGACVPELVGAWQPYTFSAGPVGAALLVLYGVVMVGLGVAAWRRRHPLLVMLSLLAVCVPILFAVSGFGGPSLNPYGFDATGRYTLPLAALLPLPLAGCLGWLWARRSVGGRLLAAGVAAFVLGNALAGYVAADNSLVFQSEYWHRLPIHDTALRGCLGRLGVRDVWMNHWAGYPLMFATRESIVAADYNDVVLNGGVNRLPWTLRAVRAAPRPAYVLVTGTAAPTPLERRLRVLGVRYRRCVALPYQVVQPVSRRVDPHEVAATIGYQY